MKLNFALAGMTILQLANYGYYYSQQINNAGTFYYSRFPIIGDKNSQTSTSPAVIIIPRGGLGNQLFQYSAAFALAQKRNSNLYICYTFRAPQKERISYSTRDRSYALDKFKIANDKLLIVEKGEPCWKQLPMSDRGSRPPISTTDVDLAFNKIPNSSNQVIEMTGVFASEIYFREYKEQILKLFELKNEKQYMLDSSEILSNINESESVAIHIRRGDYKFVKKGALILPLVYYEKAMELMTNSLKNNSLVENTENYRSIRFFVFSDEIQAAKIDFRQEIDKNGSYDITFVSSQNFSRLHDLLLMTKCIIISSSTFSWWAAYLNRNPDKIVIAPKPKYSMAYTDGVN